MNEIEDKIVEMMEMEYEIGHGLEDNDQLMEMVNNVNDDKPRLINKMDDVEMTAS